MQFVEPKVTPISTGDSTNEDMVKVVERAYRICYKSEGKMKEGSESLIHKLLYGGEHGQMIHTSPLEHRRVTLAADDWIIDAVSDWQNERGTSFINIHPQKTPSADEHQWLLEGNFRAFFDFIKGYETDEDDIKGDYGRRDEARLVINSELNKFFPVIFKWMDPYDDTENAIDWEGCDYIGESTDYMSFHIITSRDMLQELARHRSLSPNVESTRYCNYSKRGMSICCPLPYEWAADLVGENCHGLDQFGPNAKVFAFDVPKDIKGLYRLAACLSEMFYNKAIEYGAIPQEARGLLLGCLKTELILTGTYSDWAHFIRLRDDDTVDPQMQYLAKHIHDWFKSNGVADIDLYDVF